MVAPNPAPPLPLTRLARDGALVVVRDWPARMGAPVAAAYLGISESWLRRGALAGTHPQPRRDGKRCLWDRVELDAWLARQREDGAPSADAYEQGLAP